MKAQFRVILRLKIVLLQLVALDFLVILHLLKFVSPCPSMNDGLQLLMTLFQYN